MVESSIPTSDNAIEAIVFVQFDNKAGAKIYYQVPENFFDERTFKSLETYFIARTNQLHDRLIVTELENCKTIGIPVLISHCGAGGSGRQVSILNIVIVTKLSANTSPYEKILNKLISYLKIFERENQFLSSEGGPDRIKEILYRMYHGINEHGRCSVNCSVNVQDKLNLIKLSYVDMSDEDQKLIPIGDSDVPIVTANLQDSALWDLSLRELYSFLDNQKPVRLLAAKSHMHIDQVRKCVQSLIYYGLGYVISPIQYSNTYYVTEVINKAMYDKKLQDECIRYVVINPDNPPPTWENIFNLYQTFQTGIQLKKLFVVEKPFQMNITELGMLVCVVLIRIDLVSDSQPFVETFLLSH